MTLLRHAEIPMSNSSRNSYRSCANVTIRRTLCGSWSTNARSNAHPSSSSTLPAGDFNLLQLAERSASYSIDSLTAGICCVIAEQLVQGREEGDTFIFLRLDRILPLAVPHPKTLMASLVSARWLLKEIVTGTYAKFLEEHFLKLRSTMMCDFHYQLHLVDAILTFTCNVMRKESIWLGCSNLRRSVHTLILRGIKHRRPNMRTSIYFKGNDTCFVHTC